MDHETIASTGYRQTGPTMPLDLLEANNGGVAPEALDLFVDLAPFWTQIDGESVYRDAIAHVDAMWDSGLLDCWADATTLVEAHTPHPPVAEGLEGAEYELVDDAEAEDADSDAGEVAGVEDGGVAPAQPPVVDDVDGGVAPARPPLGDQPVHTLKHSKLYAHS